MCGVDLHLQGTQGLQRYPAVAMASQDGLGFEDGGFGVQLVHDQPEVVELLQELLLVHPAALTLLASSRRYLNHDSSALRAGGRLMSCGEKLGTSASKMGGRAGYTAGISACTMCSLSWASLGLRNCCWNEPDFKPQLAEIWAEKHDLIPANKFNIL